MANSIIGRTRALFSGGSVSSSRQVNVRLMRPSIALAEAAALATWADGFRLEVTITPRSFSSQVVATV